MTGSAPSTAARGLDPAAARDAAARRRSARLAQGALWSAFVLVHLALTLLARYAPGWALGDVDRVYADWAHGVVSGRLIPGLQLDFVYPVVALVPMLVSALGGFGSGFAVVWLVQVTILNAAAFAILIGSGRSRSRVVAGWWLLAAWLLLGPIAVSRIDAITVALGIVAVLFLRLRPVLAAGLAAVATWIKVWPVAILAVQAFVAGRWRAALLIPAAIGVAAILLATALGHPLAPLSFLSQQGGRGIQVESVVATPYMLAAAFGARGVEVYYDDEILTFQVSTAGTGEAVGMIVTIAQIVAAIAIVLLAMRARRRGGSWRAVVPVALLALIAALIVFNKVGSPQFESWLIVPVVLGLVVSRRAFRVPAAIVLAIEAATHAMYPYLYPWLLGLDPVQLGVLVLRNALLVALLAWSVVRLCRSRVGGLPREAEGAHDRRILGRAER